MRIRRFLGSLIALSLCLGSVSASSPDVQVAVVSICGNTVNVSVHNSSASPTSTRVTTTVRLVDNSTQVLTSAALTVAAGGTQSIALIAAKPVAVIDDDPIPIAP